MNDIPNDLIEAGQAGIMLGFYMVKRLNDGADLEDLTDFLSRIATDVEFGTMLKKAAVGSSDIPREIKEMSLKGWGGVTKAMFNQIVIEMERWSDGA